jgi:hypothetical protein
LSGFKKIETWRQKLQNFLKSIHSPRYQIFCSFPEQFSVTNFSNPLSGPNGPVGPSSPYVSGGSFYADGAFYTPGPGAPFFSNPFSFGVVGSGSIEGGYFWGAGADANIGGGLFYNPGSGVSVGRFWGYGAFAGGPTGSFNTSASPGGNHSAVVGASAGVGAGVWVSNAGSPDALGGSFDQINLNFPVFGVSVAYANGVWIASVTKAASLGQGASGSQYPTTTTTADGINLTTLQPIAYHPPK